MKILSIETSCDETAIALIASSGNNKKPKFKTLWSKTYSQVKLHEQYGGVFPNVAKREHSRKLVPILEVLLKKNILKKGKGIGRNEKIKKIEKLLVREPDLFKAITESKYLWHKIKIDKIAVTSGPGLEPALWVGINFAKALSIIWEIPVSPVNHMQGHFLAPMAEGKEIEFPALGLLISGGHTEIVLAQNPINYKLLGKTRDDACGEAYDKVARILGLSYPGGPLIAKLAEDFRKTRSSKLEAQNFVLPRPMIHTNDLDFSFSGLKTAVLYLTQKIKNINEEEKSEIAREFEEAVKDVLVSKTKQALKISKAKTLVIGGGVSANKYISDNLKMISKINNINYINPSKKLATDNAVMIGIAGFFTKTRPIYKIKAEGNLLLTK